LKSAQAFKQVLKLGLVRDLSPHFHSFAFILGRFILKLGDRCQCNWWLKWNV